ncbi:uncharacterized protein LOC112350161 isoform X2 [Selaginella moellendorffii]|uniref:uncharacterized protein LOC112350161 isoform X2 n=1 Tax=Selaginella moellendorffii TaxID=88036 RepID=UPI000D1CD203|nr:uncharacterized protein LOC112350161 isoform X2 [Selaginella moellendorffii]|eukprot:XP_024541661.1 uncharacterized protein LOC112350161 isoform X2 [Selaginella moellendorffii]
MRLAATMHNKKQACMIRDKSVCGVRCALNLTVVLLLFMKNTKPHPSQVRERERETNTNTRHTERRESGTGDPPCLQNAQHKKFIQQFLTRKSCRPAAVNTCEKAEGEKGRFFLLSQGCLCCNWEETWRVATFLTTQLETTFSINAFRFRANISIFMVNLA